MMVIFPGFGCSAIVPDAPAAFAAVLYHLTNRLAGLPLVVLCKGSPKPREHVHTIQKPQAR
jgi:hypothetical protein